MSRSKPRSRAGDDPNSAEGEVEMTPMIDVTFLLLIFFVMNLNVVLPEGELQSFLPKDRGQGRSSAVVLDELRVQLLWCDASGREITGDQPGAAVLKLGRRRLAEPGELTASAVDHPAWRALGEELTAIKRGLKDPGKKGPAVIIDARPAVPWQLVVKTVDVLVAAGITDVTFAAPAKPIR